MKSIKVGQKEYVVIESKLGMPIRKIAKALVQLNEVSSNNFILQFNNELIVIHKDDKLEDVLARY